MSQMKALVYNVKSGSLLLVKKDIPKITSPDDVIVRVAYSGVCGTDLHVLDGGMPCKDGNTMGHEFGGVVVEVGSEVKHLKAGDKVAVDPNDSCRKCHHCQSGKYQFCQVEGTSNNIGFFKDGGWSEHFKAPSRLVYKLPDNLSLSTGALCEPISCIAHGWDILGPVPHSSKVLIMGAGIIGNLWAALFHLQGHRNVIISEPQEARRKLAEKIGYEVVAPTVLKQRHLDGNWGVDVIVDCTGFAPAMEEAMNWLLPGGRYCIFGVAPKDARVKISPYLMFKRELTILGVIVNPFTFNKAIGLSQVMESKYLKYENLGIKIFSLDQHEEAIAALRKGLIAKAVFKMHDS